MNLATHLKQVFQDLQEIDPRVLSAIPARHTVTHDEELLFDVDTLGTMNPNQCWAADESTKWQVAELGDFPKWVCCRLKMTLHGGAWQALFESSRPNHHAWYFVYTDGESGVFSVARIEEVK